MQELMSAVKRREGASNSSGIYVPSVVESHLCKLPYKETSVHCVSDLSRRDKCLLKLKNKIIIH